MQLLLAASCLAIAAATVDKYPENVFSRGELDYRNLVLDKESASLYVGARGRIFRLWAYNLNDTSETLYSERRIAVSDSELAECTALGNLPDDCQPSTRFMSLQDQKEALFVCSSVGMKPEIRVLDASTLKDRVEARTEIGTCAPDASVNATAVVVEWGNPHELPAIYSGIRTGMSGENHLIYRPALLDKGKEVVSSMRTMYTDNKWLNEPQFVGSFDVGEYVYVFFREIALENGGVEGVVHSRVARVCKKDTGGRVVLRQLWTSFVKARLNCSISAQYPFYFDHIQAVTRLESHDDTLFYASMSTSDTAFVSSAICVFSLKAINQLFHHGLFLEQSGSSWLPLPPDAVPSHRPGTCVSDTQSLSDSDLHFAKSHLLMAEPVSGGRPLLTSREAVFSHLVIDQKAEQNVIFAVDGRTHDMWKVAHWKDGSDWRWSLLEKRKLSIEGTIKAVALLPGEFLYTASQSAVSQFSLSSCPLHTSCALCAVDPYCSWNAARSSCYAREKIHGQSLGWISSWAGRGASECVAAMRTIEKRVYPGDSIHIDGMLEAVWLRDGKRLTMSDRIVFSKDGGLILLNLDSSRNGVYECILDGKIINKYKVVVDHEECTKPKTLEAFHSCQREWCKRADGYKSALLQWQDQQRKNVQCMINDSQSTQNNRLD